MAPFNNSIDQFFEKIDLKSGDSMSFESFFDKWQEKIVKVVLEWKTDKKYKPDLDISALMLNSNGKVTGLQDIVCYNTRRRWATEAPIDSPDFDPLKGEVSFFEENANASEKEMKKNYYYWLNSTLPLSPDDSVIGSWDDRGDDSSHDADETLHVRFSEFDSQRYSAIAIVASVAPDDVARGYTFGDAVNPVVKIIAAEDGVVLAEYKLASTFGKADGVCFGYLTFDAKNRKWEFEAKDIAYSGGLPAIYKNFVE